MGLTLAPFTEEETRRFVRRHWARMPPRGSSRMPSSSLVHGKTNGLPLYVEQVGAACSCRIHRVPQASLYKRYASCSKQFPDFDKS